MSNLKPLAWDKDGKSWTAYGAGISYTITEFDGVATVSWHNMVKSAKDLPFSSDKRTLLSYSEALDFVENEHYPHFMSEFVKPSPTWIDVNERLPEQNTEVLVRYHAHFDDEEVKEFDFCTAFFYGKLFDVKDQHFYIRRTTKVTHWMPLPEPPVSKESDCE